MNRIYKRIEVKEEWKAPRPVEAPKGKTSKKKTEETSVELDSHGVEKLRVESIALASVSEELGVKPVEGQLYDFEVNGKKVKVVSKSFASKIGPNMTAILPEEQFSEDSGPDAYVFVRVSKNLKESHIGGWLDRRTFNRISRYQSKGDVKSCGYETTSTGYSVRFIQLNPLESLTASPSDKPKSNWEKFKQTRERKGGKK